VMNRSPFSERERERERACVRTLDSRRMDHTAMTD
jgi:hypothetical protein